MNRDLILLFIKALFSLGALGALVWVVFRPMWKALNTHPNVLLPENDYGQAMLQAEELEIPKGMGNTGKPDRQAMIEAARNDPLRTANYVSSLLREKK